MNTKVKQFVQIALYIALFVVLGKVTTINIGAVRFTLKNLPIYVGAISLGSIPGAIIGFAGEFILQVTSEYGFTATTLFWVLPQTILGAICGLIFENKIVKVTSGVKFCVCIISLQLLLTILNTIVTCIDAVVYGYFNYVTIFGSIIIRIMASILVGILYCIVIPVLIKLTKKIH